MFFSASGMVASNRESHLRIRLDLSPSAYGPEQIRRPETYGLMDFAHMTGAPFLIGGGGHARAVLAAALAAGVRVRGILDPTLPVGQLVFGVPVLGGDDYLCSADANGAPWINGLGANPNTAGREGLFRKLQPRHEAMIVTHPSAVVERAASIGEGAQLMAGCVIQPGVHVGINCVVNSAASIDHDCHLEPHSFIGPGAVLSGGIVVGEGAFIGAGAVILPGVRIGSGAIVAAGAVIIADVADRAIVAGNPSRQIGRNTK